MVKNLVVRSCNSSENKIIGKIKKENQNILEVHHVPQLIKFEEEVESKTNIREIGRQPVGRRRRNSIIRRKEKNTSTITTPFIKEEDEKRVFNGGKELFIYLSILNDGIRTWYKVDPNGTTTTTSSSSSSEGNKTQILSPICSIPNNIFPVYYRTIGFDSKLYVIGGYSPKKDFDDHGHVKRYARSKAFVCDTSSGNPVWEKCSSMKSCKIGPQLAVVDGEVFAIGSRGSMTFQFRKPYAEVFNPSLNKWTALPSPPCGINLASVSDCVFLRDRDEIIIFPSSYGCYRHDAYRFNVKSNTWTSFSNPFNVRTATNNTTTSVAVGDVVFRFRENRLYACDMSQPKLVLRRVYGLEKEIKSLMSGTGHLFYIGNGKLCLTWCFHSKEHCDMTVIACLKFWVGLCEEKRRLLAVIDRCDHYLANGRTCICDCVAM